MQVTDNDIVKAVECCINNDWNKTKCNQCSFYTGCLGCVDELKKSTIDLINSQKAEIERSKGVIKLLEKDAAEARAELKEFKAMYVEKIAAMGIKAFVERLLKIVTIKGRQKDYFDDLVKEMTEVSDGTENRNCVQ